MIEWLDNKHFLLKEARFRIANWFEIARWVKEKIPPTSDPFDIHKQRWMIERYQRLIENHKPQTIVELGIQRGGSSVLFHHLANAEKLVGIEIDENRLTAIDEYIEKNGLTDTLKFYHGIDQSDSTALKAVIKDEFASGIDFIIDDASHLLDETRASFNVLFPHLRPGGIYVIEDWPWAHAKIGHPDETPGLYEEKEPLTKLLFEIIMACPSTHDLIAKIEIDANSITIWRGTAEVDGDKFNIQYCTLARGRNLIN